jgi:hypothetical protein
MLAKRRLLFVCPSGVSQPGRQPVTQLPMSAYMLASSLFLVVSQELFAPQLPNMWISTIGETGTWLVFHIVQEFGGDSVCHLLCGCLIVRIVYPSYPS